MTEQDERALTPLGRMPKEPFDALCAWAGRHGAALRDAQSSYDVRHAEAG